MMTSQTAIRNGTKRVMRTGEKQGDKIEALTEAIKMFIAKKANKDN